MMSDASLRKLRRELRHVQSKRRRKMIKGKDTADLTVREVHLRIRIRRMENGTSG